MPKPLFASALIALASCAAWMLSGIAAPFAWQTRYDEARLLQCLVLGLLLVTTAISPAAVWEALRRIPSWVRCSLVAALLLGSLSASRSHFAAYAFCEVAFTAALIATGIGVRACVSSDDGRFAIALLLLVCCGSLALGLRFGTEYIAVVVEHDGSALESSWHPFQNPRYFAKAATWTLPLLWLAPRLTLRFHRPLQYGSAAATVLIWSQLLGSGSRGALLGMAVSVVVAAIFFGRSGRAYGIWQTACATAGLLLWGFFALFYDVSTPDHIARTGLSGRDDLYRAALLDIRSAPVIGIGPLHYSELGRHAETSVAGTHNLPLQLAAEWGLPATLLLLAPLLALGWRLFVLARESGVAGAVSPQQPMRIAIFSSIAAAMVHGLFANVANEPISQTLFVLLAGLFPGAAPPEVHASRSPAWQGRLLMATLLLAIGAGLIFAIAKGWDCVGQPDRKDYVRGTGDSIYPRLWSQGLIPLERSCYDRASLDQPR